AGRGPGRTGRHTRRGPGQPGRLLNGGPPRMASSPITAIYALSPLQQGMLHHTRLEPESGLYVVQMACELRGPLDRTRFREAWAAVIARHDVFRTAFVRLDQDRPQQAVLARVSPPWHELDWTNLTATGRDAARR